MTRGDKYYCQETHFLPLPHYEDRVHAFNKSQEYEGGGGKLPHVVPCSLYPSRGPDMRERNTAPITIMTHSRAQDGCAVVLPV